MGGSVTRKRLLVSYRTSPPAHVNNFPLHLSAKLWVLLKEKNIFKKNSLLIFFFLPILKVTLVFELTFSRFDWGGGIL